MRVTAQWAGNFTEGDYVAIWDSRYYAEGGREEPEIVRITEVHQNSMTIEHWLRR